MGWLWKEPACATWTKRQGSMDMGSMRLLFCSSHSLACFQCTLTNAMTPCCPPPTGPAGARSAHPHQRPHPQGRLLAVFIFLCTLRQKANRPVPQPSMKATGRRASRRRWLARRSKRFASQGGYLHHGGLFANFGGGGPWLQQQQQQWFWGPLRGAGDRARCFASCLSLQSDSCNRVSTSI